MAPDGILSNNTVHIIYRKINGIDYYRDKNQPQQLQVGKDMTYFTFNGDEKMEKFCGIDLKMDYHQSQSKGVGIHPVDHVLKEN